MNDAGPYAVTEEDVEYLRHGDRPLLLRLFRPVGSPGTELEFAL